MNKFMKNENTINWIEVNNMMKNLNRTFTNEEEYVNWVREWKIDHNMLVASIKLFKDMKSAIKDEEVSDMRNVLLNKFQNTKLSLRPIAREMYRMRTDNKALFKEMMMKESVTEKELESA